MGRTKDLFVVNLKRLRNVRRYSQEKLAELSDIPASTYIKYEQAKFFPGNENIEKLADALDVPVEELFREKGRKIKSPRQELLVLIDELSPRAIDALLGVARQLAELDK